MESEDNKNKRSQADKLNSDLFQTDSIGEEKKWDLMNKPNTTEEIENMKPLATTGGFLYYTNSINDVSEDSKNNKTKNKQEF